MDLALVPLIALCVSSVLSIAALVISFLSYRNSRRAQRSSEDAHHHTQIVSFEQRREEVRVILFESQLHLGAINDCASLINRMIPLAAGVDEETRARLTKTYCDLITETAEKGDLLKSALKALDDLPASPSTESRILIEKARGIMERDFKNVQELSRVVQETSKVLFEIGPESK
jgi:hypothetical protein